MKLKISLDDMNEFSDEKRATKLIQTHLNKINHAGLSKDGIYGRKTNAALKKFQREVMNGSGSGIIGPRTLKSLYLEPGISLKALPVPASAIVKEPVISTPKRPDSELPPNVISLNTFAQKRLLLIAQAERGVKEVPGRGDNPRIVLYHKFATKDNKKGQKDSVPWCSSFNCFVAEMAGLTSTNSMMARSWEGHRSGYKNVTDNALPGDFVTFYRNGRSSGSGHVGVLIKEDSQFYWILGGNQSNAVNIKKFRKAANRSFGPTGVWRIHNERITSAQITDLMNLAGAIMAGQEIGLSGSVA